MSTVGNQSAQTALMTLEAAAISAREGFACMYSTSDEYEHALISERRAQGRYAAPRRRWPVVLFVACAIALAAVVLVFH